MLTFTTSQSFSLIKIVSDGGLEKQLFILGSYKYQDNTILFFKTIEELSD